MRTSELDYPVLCLTQSTGVCVVDSVASLERCRSTLYQRGGFYNELRIVDSSGATYRVAQARIRRPASPLGRWWADFLDLTLEVDLSLLPMEVLSVSELRRELEGVIGLDAESLEEFSGRSVEWWRRALDHSSSVCEVLRLFRSTPEAGRFP